MDNQQDSTIHVRNDGSMDGVIIGGHHNLVHKESGDPLLTKSAAELHRLAESCSILDRDGSAAPDIRAAQEAAQAAERGDRAGVREALGKLGQWGLDVAQQIGIGLLIDQLIGN